MQLRTARQGQGTSRNTQPGGKARRVRVNASAFSHYFTMPLLSAGPIIVAAIVVTALYFGWENREGLYFDIDPKTGLGYWLGIAGSLAMLVLLLYPLRKRWRAMRGTGPVPAWFRMHMLLGIGGPLMIVFHSNFELKSHNAIAASFFMLVIVVSGIIGRYIYSKIHMGLYGTKAEIKGMLTDARLMKAALGDDFEGAEHLVADLVQFEGRVLVRHTSFLASLWAFIALGWRWAGLRKRLLGEAKAGIEAEAKRRGWGRSERRKRCNLVRQHLSIYFGAVNKAARFGMYDRMFAAWHVLHMPLFFLLVLTAIVHVVAVHLY
jgi:hypothetical protein